MKISVITVVFNNVSTIGKALASVKNQTHQDIEHIVIDGGSTDGTLDVIEQYSANITKFVSEPDHGIYDAMNKGLSMATGDLVCFLNSDDMYVDSHVLERASRIIEQDSLDAIFADVTYFRADNPEKILRRYSSSRFSPEKIAYGWMPAHPTLLMRKAVFDRVGGFKSSYRIGGDFEFIARAFGKGELKYRYLPEVLVKMQMGGASTSGIRSTIKSNQEVMRACRENGIQTNYFKILSKYPYKILEFFK